MKLQSKPGPRKALQLSKPSESSCMTHFIHKRVDYGHRFNTVTILAHVWPINKMHACFFGKIIVFEAACCARTVISI